MIFEGISRDFSFADEQQFETIGQFGDEMAAISGLESKHLMSTGTVKSAIIDEEERKKALPCGRAFCLFLTG